MSRIPPLLSYMLLCLKVGIYPQILSPSVHTWLPFPSAQEQLELPLIATRSCTSIETQRASALLNAYAISMRQLARSLHSSYYSCIKPSI